MESITRPTKIIMAHGNAHSSQQSTTRSIRRQPSHLSGVSGCKASKAMHAISIMPHCRMQSRDQLNSESQPPKHKTHCKPRDLCRFWVFGPPSSSHPFDCALTTRIPLAIHVLLHSQETRRPSPYPHPPRPRRRRGGPSTRHARRARRHHRHGP
jgi:hypothetical protein